MKIKRSVSQEHSKLTNENGRGGSKSKETWRGDIFLQNDTHDVNLYKIHIIIH